MHPRNRSWKASCVTAFLVVALATTGCDAASVISMLLKYAKAFFPMAATVETIWNAAMAVSDVVSADRRPASTAGSGTVRPPGEVPIFNARATATPPAAAEARAAQERLIAPPGRTFEVVLTTTTGPP